MVGFLGSLADSFGGRKLATEKTALENRMRLTLHLKERQGRRYLHLRFISFNYILETDQADELIGALKDFRDRM